jgi:hypothetical protein
MFDIEADMCYLNGMLYHLKRSARVEGTLISKRCKAPFKGII